MTNRFMLSIALASMFGLSALALVGAAYADEEATKDADAAHIRELIRRLDDDSFEVRTQATEDLQKLGARAESALRKAMKTAESEEIRWRAEQLLMRLHGAQTRSLGGDEVAPKSAEPKAKDNTQPKARPRSPFFWGPGSVGDASMDEIAKVFRERVKQLEKQMRDIDGEMKGPNGTRSLLDGLGAFMGSRSVAVPGLRFSQRNGRAELRVEDDPAGAGQPQTYSGSSLDDILEKHPDLRVHRSMELLEEKTNATSNYFGGFTDLSAAMKLIDGLRKGSHSMGIVVGPDGRVQLRNSSVTTTRTKDGLFKVRIVERDKDGEEKVTEVEGESIEAIVRDHPELRDQLKGGGGFHISAPQLFLGDLKSLPAGARKLLDPLHRRNPFGRSTLPIPVPTPRAVFGITAARIAPSLAAQLGLAEGEGVLIQSVVPGSKAQTLGLNQYDILLTINDERVNGIDGLRGQLAGKLETGTALSVEILRAGKRQTLTK